MATFPKSEMEILGLAQEMSNGLANNVATYPAPPVLPAALSTAMSAYLVAKNEVTELQAKAELAVQTKNEALATLVEDMKEDLRYAENTVKFDDAKLKLIGWGGRHAPEPLQAPGEPLTLIAPEEGEGWILLEWKAPLTGGAVASYQLERRLRPDGPWATCALAMEIKFKLDNQERGKEWEYRVKAVNKTGIGPASNTVMAVL